MTAVELRSPKLVLNSPTVADIDAVFEYCQDPVFERFMTLPWPYRRSDAEYFVNQHVLRGWETDTEYTWALRRHNNGPLLGVVGYRAERADLGFWLGAPHRGQGLMPEAVSAVADWLFGRGLSALNWECVVGNFASLSVARKAGFTFVGERASLIADRTGAYPQAWHGTLLSEDLRDPKPGWPG